MEKNSYTFSKKTQFFKQKTVLSSFERTDKLICSKFLILMERKLNDPGYKNIIAPLKYLWYTVIKNVAFSYLKLREFCLNN